MSHNTLQNNQNNYTFNESSDLQQSTIAIQPEQTSSNVNYNDVNVDSSVVNDNISPAFHPNNYYNYYSD